MFRIMGEFAQVSTPEHLPQSVAILLCVQPDTRTTSLPNRSPNRLPNEVFHRDRSGLEFLKLVIMVRIWLVAEASNCIRLPLSNLVILYPLTEWTILRPESHVSQKPPVPLSSCPVVGTMDEL